MFSLVDITFQMVIIIICPVNVQLKTPGAEIYRPLSLKAFIIRVWPSLHERLNDQSSPGGWYSQRFPELNWSNNFVVNEITYKEKEDVIKV